MQNKKAQNAKKAKQKTKSKNAPQKTQTKKAQKAKKAKQKCTAKAHKAFVCPKFKLLLVFV